MKRISFNCVYCKKEVTTVFRGKKEPRYCASACVGGKKKQDLLDKWLSGQHTGLMPSGKMSGTIRNFLLEEAKFSCEECGWNKRHPVDNKPLVQIDHKDGNPMNCARKNLRVLCPNCHSLTPTYMARNASNPQRVLIRKTLKEMKLKRLGV